VVPLAHEQNRLAAISHQRARPLDALDPQGLPADERAACFDERSSIELTAALQLTAKGRGRSERRGSVAIVTCSWRTGSIPRPKQVPIACCRDS